MGDETLVSCSKTRFVSFSHIELFFVNFRVSPQKLAKKKSLNQNLNMFE